MSARRVQRTLSGTFSRLCATIGQNHRRPNAPLRHAERGDRESHHGAGGSMPFALMTAAASGVVRCLIRALAASGCLAVVLTPAVLTNQSWSSAGSRPTSCTPLADTSEGVG